MKVKMAILKHDSILRTMDKNTIIPPNVTIYTGSICLGNPGPGGCAAILEYKIPGKTVEQEISCGYEKTTNNRMKIMAIIVGLEALKSPCRVTVWIDSDYLVEALNKGYLRDPQQSDNKNNTIKEAYGDLWDRLWVSCTTNQVKFKWVNKNINNKNIIRCNEMANQDVKNIRLNQSFTANPTRRVMRKSEQQIGVMSQLCIDGSDYRSNIYPFSFENEWNFP
jgi:ribonuclease HI